MTEFRRPRKECPEVMQEKGIPLKRGIILPVLGGGLVSFLVFVWWSVIGDSDPETQNRRATYKGYESIEELTKEADLVVVGVVREIAGRDVDRGLGPVGESIDLNSDSVAIPMVFYRIEVSSVLKGQPDGNMIIVATGDPERINNESETALIAGQSLLLFLDDRTTDPISAQKFEDFPYFYVPLSLDTGVFDVTNGEVATSRLKGLFAEAETTNAQQFTIDQIRSEVASEASDKPAFDVDNDRDGEVSGGTDSDDDANASEDTEGVADEVPKIRMEASSPGYFSVKELAEASDVIVVGSFGNVISREVDYGTAEDDSIEDDWGIPMVFHRVEVIESLKGEPSVEVIVARLDDTRIITDAVKPIDENDRYVLFLFDVTEDAHRFKRYADVDKDIYITLSDDIGIFELSIDGIATPRDSAVSKKSPDGDKVFSFTLDEIRSEVSSKLTTISK